MLELMILSKGRPWSGSFSWSRYASALIASSPRTAYWTLSSDGLIDSTVNGRIFWEEAVVVVVRDRGLGERDALAHVNVLTSPTTGLRNMTLQVR